MMENFIIVAEEELNRIVNINDDENEEKYEYMKDGYNCEINKIILKSHEEGKENLVEMRVKRNDNVYRNNKKGKTLEESCWVYIENKNCVLSSGKDYAKGRKDSKIKNGLSYQNYRLSRY